MKEDATSQSTQQNSGEEETIPETPYAVRYMTAILGQRVTCTLDDGRTATGQLACVERV